MITAILHADLNCFYAGVEMNERPELRGKAIAVCGSTEDRHGIVLTKSYPAKAKGVKTGMANWEAKRLCPELICVPPRYDLYLQYSRAVRSIYARYSDEVEPFGLDESWIAIRGCRDLRGDAMDTAEEIRRAVREETGLTVSIGVSFNKIFAKLGSDMKKPDAITLLDEDNWKERVWPLAATELLYVGPATRRKLSLLNAFTVGDLARLDPELLQLKLGKNGLMLWAFANGRDISRVSPIDYEPPIKSVGHGTTCVVDLDNEYAVWLVLYELAQDVGHRLRESELAAKGVQLTVKDKDLAWRQYQAPLPQLSQSPLEIAQTAFALFRAHYDWSKPVRALTVRGIALAAQNSPVQLDWFDDAVKREKRKSLDDAVDDIRRRFGYRAICAASLMGDKKMAQDRCEIVTMPNLMFM